MKTKYNAFFEYKRDTDESPSLSPPNSRHNIEAHFHRQFEIFYVTQGQARVAVNGEERLLRADQLALCDSFDEHSLLTPTENDLAISLIIPFSLMTDYRNRKGNMRLSTAFVLDRETALRFKALIDTLSLFLGNAPNPVSADLMRSLLSLAAHTVGFTQHKERGSASLRSEILQYLSDHFIEELTPHSVSRHFGYSPYYFSKLFAQSFHTSFGVYLNMLRLKQTLWLVEHENTSILDAALCSGFNSEATFYRFVRKHFDATPMELIRQLRQDSTRI